MKVWPASLPQGFLLSNSSSGFGDGRLRSRTDAGGAKVRRRFSYVPIPLSGSMIMTKAEKLPSWSAVADHWEVSLDLLTLP